MSWNDLDAADLAEVSFPAKASGMMLRREPGKPRIVVSAVPDKAIKVIYLRVPQDFHDRLHARVSGSKSAAIIAVMEEALDRLEQGNERWRVVERENM